MTRDKLKERLGDRSRFKGTFDKYGLKSGWKGLPKVTLCLVDVKTMIGEEPVTDHLWMNLTKGFKDLTKEDELLPGDLVAFDARVTPYEKGYKGNREGEWDEKPVEIDYRLSHPTKITRIKKAPREGKENFYTVCPRCSFRNVTSEHTGRCRRCGHDSELHEEKSELNEEKQKLTQGTLPW